MNLPYGGFNADFVVYRGTDALMEFFVKDLDRKPIASQGKSYRVSIVAYDTYELMATVPGRVEDAYRGLIQVNLKRTDTAGWPSGFYRYFVTIVNEDGTENPLYVDQNRSAVGYLEVRADHLPRPAPSYTVVSSDFIPTSATCGLSQAYPGSTNYSYFQRTVTIALYMSNFSGEIVVQGSLDDTPEQDSNNWFNLDMERVNQDSPEVLDFSNFTGIATYNNQGNYQWLRVSYCKDVSNTGTLDKTIIKV